VEEALAQSQSKSHELHQNRSWVALLSGRRDRERRRITQDIVVVNGKEERHPEGAYYLDWRANGVRVRLSVGNNAQDVLTQRDRKK